MYPIQCIIKQVQSGIFYEGTLEIGNWRNKKFTFKLKLAGPISGICQRKPSADVAENRIIFRLTLGNASGEIKLTDAEFSFFYPIVLMFAADCEAGLLRASAAKFLCANSIRFDFGSHHLPVIKNQSEVSLVINCNLSPNFITMLNNDKFDCQIPVEDEILPT